MMDMNYAVKELENYRRNTVKISPQIKDEFPAGDIVKVYLPDNALVDMSTFRMHFDVEISGATAASDIAPPRGTPLFIDAIEVSSNNVPIGTNFRNYNVLFNALNNATCDQSVEVGQNAVYALGNVKKITLGAQATSATISDLVCEKWLGLLGDAGVIYTGKPMLPGLLVSLTLASKAIIAASAGAPTYTLKKVYFTVDVIQGSEMLQTMLSSIGSTPELAFTNIASVSDTASNIKFAINTKHLYHILAVPHVASHTTQGALVEVSGGFNDTKYFQSSQQSTSTYQVQVGDTYYPNYAASAGRAAWSDIQKMFGKTRDVSVGSLVVSDSDFTSNKYVLGVNFAHTGDASALSGLDTRGITQNGTFMLNNKSGANVTDLFLIYKSILAMSQDGILVQN